MVDPLPSVHFPQSGTGLSVGRLNTREFRECHDVPNPSWDLDGVDAVWRAAEVKVQILASLARSAPIVPTSTSSAPNMTVAGVQVLSEEAPSAQSQILTDDALKFLAALHRTFESARQSLLVARAVAQQRLDAGVPLDFLPETANIRADPAWLCAPPGPGLEDRRVEITGPPDRKMVINALNSGAKTFMADFEGASHGVSSVCAISQSCMFRFQLPDIRKPSQWSSEPA